MEELRAYAEERKLTYAEGVQLPRATPSLEFLGPARSALTGVLPGGSQGTLAHYEVSGEDGSFEVTMVVIEVGESIAFCPRLYCRDAAYRHTRTIALGAEGFRAAYRTEEFESETVNRTYAVQVSPDQDALWLRELFSPVFLDWLAERAPLEFTFELVEGTLCARLPGKDTSTSRLDLMCELASWVAERIRGESLEEDEGDVPFDHALPAPAQTEDRRRAEEAAAKLDWPQPPENVAAALQAYRPIARREPGGWMPALKVGAGVGGLVVLVGAPLGYLFGFLFSDFGDWAKAGMALLMAGCGVALGLFLFAMARRSQVFRRARAYGQLAFFSGYARAHDLELEDEKAFHARFLRLKLPGPVRHVMRGTLPEAGRFGRLVVCADPTQASGGHAIAIVPVKPRSVSAHEGVTLDIQGDLELALVTAPASTGPRVEDLDRACAALADSA